MSTNLESAQPHLFDPEAVPVPELSEKDRNRLEQERDRRVVKPVRNWKYAGQTPANRPQLGGDIRTDLLPADDESEPHKKKRDE